MSISSSLNAGVAGLNSNGTRLATISDNISNASTYGYKRAVAEFQNMVIGEGTGVGFSAGGVRATTGRLVDVRSSLISTSNPTDISISGRGMLPVTELSGLADNPDQNELLLVSTGSFRPDSDGYLRTPSGHVLMGWPADADGTVPEFPRDTVDGLEPIVVALNQIAANPTTRIGVGVNLPSTATTAGAIGESQVLSIEYFDNMGSSERLGVTFVPTVPTSGSSNSWTMTITDSASDDATIGSYVLVFDESRSAGGTLLSVTSDAGDSYDSETGLLDLNVAGGPMSLDIGKLGDPAGITQLGDSFLPTSITRDGSPGGSLSSVEIDPIGNLIGTYDGGFTRTLYKVPVVDVRNPNGLIPMENQAFSISRDSGPFFLWDAGQGPTGAMAGFSREESATDVATELTSLIQTQRAYSSNAKVIQTVDEMLQETTNLKR
jgi:flagellar hook protein FlgE